MTVYIVLADTYDCGYGSDLHIFLVTMDEMTAIKRYIELANEYGMKNTKLKQTTLEVDCDIAIGGYIE